MRGQGGGERGVLTGVSGGGAATTVYDGDGNRVKQVVSGTTTFFVNGWYEVQRGTPDQATTYYIFGGKRIAVRDSAGTLTFLHSDHLGGTAATTSGVVAGGSQTSKQKYYAYGTIRTTVGTVPTPYEFTGQRLDAYINLYWYGSRFYDPALGVFIQPDTIVPQPGNSQAYNRYSYVLNNPLRFVDPTGRFTEDELEGMGYTKQQIARWKGNDRWWALIFKAHVGDVLSGLDANGHTIYIKFIGDVNSLGPGNRGSVAQRTVALGIEGPIGNVDLEQFYWSGDSLDLYSSESGQLTRRTTATQFLKATMPKLSLWYDPSSVDQEDALNDASSLAAIGVAIGAGALGFPGVAQLAATVSTASDLVSLQRHLSQLSIDQDPSEGILDATRLYAGPRGGPIVTALSLLKNLASGIRIGMR